jgi:hypothetical protein
MVGIEGLGTSHIILVQRTYKFSIERLGSQILSAGHSWKVPG